MKVCLLAGGLGTRLAEETQIRPKPMVEIGGKPILWHIMQIYAAHGFREFVVALGYRGEMIRDYFANFYQLNNDLTIDLATGQVTAHHTVQLDWLVHLVDTGLHTQTAGGSNACSAGWKATRSWPVTAMEWPTSTLRALLAFHRAHGRLATVTAVRLLLVSAGWHRWRSVIDFVEKPQAGEGWINGGFFIFEPGVLDYLRATRCRWNANPCGDWPTKGN